MTDNTDAWGGADPRERIAKEAKAEGGYRPYPSFSEWMAGLYDPSVFDRTEHQLRERRADAGEDALRAAVVRASRSAAVDTGAIEGLYTVDRGFTYTVASQAAEWEAVVDSKGESAKRAIQDALNAYEYVLDAATESVEITEVWIRELHAIICASQETYTVYTAVGPQQQTLAKGSYKELPNNPWNPSTGHKHHYAPVWDTAPEMSRLISEMREEQFRTAHPVLQASYAHYAYVCVHPFPDGNGRVARALASVFLYRRPGVPLVIFADQRSAYFDALEAADEGRYVAFINFIESAVIDTMGIIAAQIQPPRIDPLASIAELERYYSVNASEQVYYAAASRLARMAQAALQNHLAELPIPKHIEAMVMKTGGQPRPPAGYVNGNGDSQFRLRLEAPNPTPALTTEIFGAFVAQRRDSSTEDLALGFSGDADFLPVSLREIDPVATEALRLKVEGWAHRKAAEYLDRLRAEVAKAAARSGRA